MQRGRGDAALFLLWVLRMLRVSVCGMDVMGISVIKSMDNMVCRKMCMRYGLGDDMSLNR